MPEDKQSSIFFDRGTIVIPEDRGAQESLSLLTEAVWDDRVGAYRAPAHKLSKIEEHLCLKQAALDGDSPRENTNNPYQWQNIPLRPYQQAALTAWAMHNYRGMIVLPTGAGKTRLALAAAAKLKVRTLCLVPTRVLMGQWQSEIGKIYSGPVGKYGDGDRIIHEITVATFESGWRHMTRLGNLFDLLIVDEAHHFGDAMKDEALEMSSARLRLGLTATPVTNEKAACRLADLIGNVVFSQGIADLSGTFLAPFEIFTWHLPLTSQERQIYERDTRLFRQFLRSLRRERPDASWHEIIRTANQTPEGEAAISGQRRARDLVALTEAKVRAVMALIDKHVSAKILIFTANSAAAYHLSRLLLMPAITAHISRKERDEIVTKFRKGDYPVLISCRVLNEGVDIPDADVAIILGGSSGIREHVQRIGRVLRPSEGKVAAVYELIAQNTFEVYQARSRKEGLHQNAARIC